MTTANQIIDQALGVLGVKSPGVAASGNEAAQALERLNTMLDGWRTESLFAYASERVTFTLPANTETATIGPTGDFVVDPRPTRIEGGFFTSGGLDYPIDTGLTEAEFDGISLKALSTLGPSYVFYSGDLPNGTLRFYPRASVAVVVTLNVQTQVSEFADLTTSYDLAPGYRRALAFSLAEEICSDYERQVTPATAKIAALSRRNIKRVNHVVPQLGGRLFMSDLARFYAGYPNG
jgi:hypothetical protein